MFGFIKKIGNGKDKKNDKKQDPPKKDNTTEQKQAIEELKKLKEQVKPDITKEKYNEIKEQKTKWMSQAGESAEAKAVGTELEESLQPIGDEFLRREKQQQKRDAHETIIKEQRNTPLETLIKKNKQLGDDNSIKPTDGQPGKNAPEKKSVFECVKEKICSIPGAVKDNVKDTFSSWTNMLSAAHSLLTGTMDTGAEASGVAGGSSDVQDIDTVIKEINNADASGAGIAGAAMGGISAVVKSIKTICSIVSQIKKDCTSGGEVIRDSQERWKLSRKYIREIVEIIGGFQGAFGPWSKMIPFFNSIAGLCVDGATMALDVTDMIDHSVHIEFMRRDRKRIYEKIQAKRAKYLSKENRDAEAAAAYDIGEKNKSSKVDKKRRALMEQLGKQKGGLSEVKNASSVELRSRNDSKYRAVQYDLGNRINQAGEKVNAARNSKDAAAVRKAKTEKRQLEALEMMEEYREIDKAHKKMSKALVHDIESILVGGVSIVGNGLNLAGEIAVASGVGAGVGAGLLTAGTSVGIAKGSYSLARNITASTYKGVRTLIGTEDNKATTREDMAISLINRMSEVGNSPVWNNTSGKFVGDLLLSQLDRKVVVRQARNVEHLHNVFRRGLDVTMSDMIESKTKADLKEKIMGAFGQD